MQLQLQKKSWNYKIKNSRIFSWSSLSASFILDAAKINLLSGKKSLAILVIYPVESKWVTLLGVVPTEYQSFRR
jgi:hypothetical protein